MPFNPIEFKPFNCSISLKDIGVSLIISICVIWYKSSLYILIILFESSFSIKTSSLEKYEEYCFLSSSICFIFTNVALYISLLSKSKVSTSSFDITSISILSVKSPFFTVIVFVPICKLFPPITS